MASYGWLYCFISFALINVNFAQVSDSFDYVEPSDEPTNGEEIEEFSPRRDTEEPQVDVQNLENRVVRLEKILTSIQNGLQSVQVEVKSLRKVKSQVSPRGSISKSDFDWKTGRKEFSYDWYIDNFSALNSSYQEDDFIKSPKFYIAAKSYRMFMGTYPVGRSSLPTLSLEYLGIYGGVARGAYDSLLSWPFRARFDLLIVDQTDDNPKNIETTVIPGKTCGKEPERTAFGVTSSSYRLYFHGLTLDRYQEDIACGNPFLIRRDILSTRNYVKDDKILFRMKVYLD